MKRSHKSNFENQFKQSKQRLGKNNKNDKWSKENKDFKEAWTHKNTRIMTKGWSEKTGQWEECDNVNKSLRSLKVKNWLFSKGKGILLDEKIYN